MEKTHRSYLSSDVQVSLADPDILWVSAYAGPFTLIGILPISPQCSASQDSPPPNTISTLSSILCMAFSMVNLHFLHLYAKPLLVLFCWYLVNMNRPPSAYPSGSLGHRIYYTESYHCSQALLNLQGSNSLLCFCCLGQSKNIMI